MFDSCEPPKGAPGPGAGPRFAFDDGALSETTDADLLDRVARGDIGAVGVLYDRYCFILFPIAWRILHERAEAEDLLHDAFVTVCARAGQYSIERGPVVAWLVTLVRNLSIDRRRRTDRRRCLVGRVLWHEPRAQVPSPETLVSDAGDHAKVHRALASLPGVQRETLEIAFFEGLTYAEIAVRERVAIGTVKSRAARAMASLRDTLERDGIDLASRLRA